MTELSPLYRGERPEIPLPVYVRQHAGPVIVHRADLPQLQQAGVPNAVTLPYGGPQPGEVWVQL